MTARHSQPAAPALLPVDRLLDSSLRLSKLGSEAALRQAIVEEGAALLQAQRVLLVLQHDGAMQVAGSKLPSGESAEALLLAVAPWLTEADHRRQLAALAAHRNQAPVDGDEHPVLLENLGVGNMVQATHLGCKKTFRRNDLEPATGTCHQLGSLHAGMAAVVVKQQRVGCRFDIARADVPARHHQFIALFKRLGVGQATGGDDDHIRVTDRHFNRMPP